MSSMNAIMTSGKGAIPYYHLTSPRLLFPVCLKRNPKQPIFLKLVSSNQGPAEIHSTGTQLLDGFSFLLDV